VTDNSSLNGQFLQGVLDELGPVAVTSATRDHRGEIVDFRYEMVNHAFCAVLHEDEAFLVGSGLLELYPSHQDLGLFDEYRRVVETGEPYVSELPWFDERNLQAFLEVRVTKFGDGYVMTGRDVTESKLSAALKELLDPTHDAIISVDPDLRVQAWDAGAERLFGSSEAAALGCGLPGLLPDGIAQDVGAVMGAVLRGVAVDAREAEIVRPDGSRQLVEVQATPVLGLDGTPIGASAIVRDLSERADSRDGTGEDRAMFETVMANVSDLIVIIGGDMRLRFVSEAARRILGHDPADWVGRDAFDLLHPEDVGLAVESLATTLSSGTGVKEPLLLRLRHSDGSWRQLEILTNNLLEVEDVGGLVVTARDVSERLVAEATASEARDRFEQAFDRAPIGMALVANDGTLMRVNDAFAHMLGGSTRDLTGRNLLSLAAPEDRKRAVLHAIAVLETDERSPVEVRFERRDGANAWARVTSTMIRDHAGRPLHAVVHLEDITEQRNLRDELEEAATHDPLTGLLNRAGFEQAYERTTTRANGYSAVFVIDLDSFKPVNDTYGHQAGDHLLQLVAARLRSCLRSDELAARLGGDEFGVYVADIADAADALALGERLRAVLATPYRLERGVVTVSGSVGVGLVHGRVDLTVALAAADRASYQAKHNGGNEVGFAWCTSTETGP
jgi:diguanylate cyclase (GGDEF)-like protein/PAS domain S-box-containing protein